MNVPDYFEAIVAYRAWSVLPGGLLMGQAFLEPWPPYQPMVGRCGRGTSSHLTQQGEWKPPPVLKCDCGIHAYKTIEEAKARTEPRANRLFGFGYDRYASAWGSIRLWGRIIEHEQGYRAEFAYPEELYCYDEKLAKGLARIYGVPCHTVEEPKREEEPDYDVMFWGGSGRGKSFYIGTPFQISSPLQSLYRSVSYDPPKVHKAPTAIQATSLAQIQAIKAAPWQKQQAQIKTRQSLGRANWKEEWQRAFYVNKQTNPGILR